MGDAFSLQGCERKLPDFCSCSPSSRIPLPFGTSNACYDGTEKFSDLKDFCNLDICYQLPSEWITKHSELLTSCLPPLARSGEEASPAAERGRRDERLGDE